MSKSKHMKKKRAPKHVHSYRHHHRRRRRQKYGTEEHKNKKKDTGLQLLIFVSLLIIIVVALVVLVPQPPYERKYYAGEIFVYFYSEVGFENASNVIINEFKCKILQHAYMKNQTGAYIEFYIQVPVGQEKEYVKRFAQHPWVNEARLSYAE